MIIPVAGQTGRQNDPGALAQLVEHIVHIDGVTGSSPVSTTQASVSSRGFPMGH